ncbi:organic anion transporter 3-like [Ornithodoros turicata]|uniref:organic anion transporter 3-like n=1 Tax=Ornithodoros turicata TaxID=34597 RepID=UPI0031393DAD
MSKSVSTSSHGHKRMDEPPGSVSPALTLDAGFPGGTPGASTSPAASPKRPRALSPNKSKKRRRPPREKAGSPGKASKSHPNPIPSAKSAPQGNSNSLLEKLRVSPADSPIAASKQPEERSPTIPIADETVTANPLEKEPFKNHLNINLSPHEQTAMTEKLAEGALPSRCTDFRPTKEKTVAHAVAEEPAVQANVEEPVVQAIMGVQAAVKEPVLQATMEEPVVQSGVEEPVLQHVVEEPALQHVVEEPAVQAVVEDLQVHPRKGMHFGARSSMKIHASGLQNTEAKDSVTTPHRRPQFSLQSPESNFLNPVPICTALVPYEAKGSPQQQANSSTEDNNLSDPTIVPGHGCYQRMALFCGQLAGFVFLTQHMAVILTTPYTDHWCKPPPEFADVSLDEWKNRSIPRGPDGALSHCLVYDPPLPSPSVNRTTRRCSQWVFDKTDYHETLQSRWGLVCDWSHLVGIQQTIYMSGAMAAVPVAGMVSDRIGRKPVIFMAVVILLIAGFTTCFAKHFHVYVVARFLVSGATASIRIMTFILLFEITTPELRLFNCIIVQVGLVAAAIFIHCLKRLHLSMNWVDIILLIPAACLICTGCMLQESPRWLLATNNYKKAEDVLTWAAALNGVRCEEAQVRWKRLVHNIRRSEDAMTPHSGILQLVRSETLKGRTFILFACWTSSLLTFYQLLLYRNQETSVIAQFLSVLAQAPALVISFLLMEKVGRRQPFFVSLMASGLLMVILLLLSLSHMKGLPLDIIIIATNLVVNVVTSIIYVYTLELYPTTLRSAGISACFLFGRVGSVLAGPLTDVARVTHSSVPYLVPGILNVISGVFAMRLVETRKLQVVNSVGELEKQMERMKLLELSTNPIRGRQRQRRRWRK